MAKKKSRAVVKKGPPPKLPKVFDCPKCSHSLCVDVKIKRTRMEGELACRVCRIKFQMKINPLMKEVQVYYAWRDHLQSMEDLDLGFSAGDRDVPISKHSKHISKNKL